MSSPTTGSDGPALLDGPVLLDGPAPLPGPAASFPRVRRQPRPSVVLLVASFGAFLAFLDSTIVNVAFPDMQRSFPDAALSSLSWVLNAYNIVLAAFLVAAGRLADLLGRRRVFVLGVAVFTVASALCAVATTVEQLVGFRVLQGVGAALLVPASLALVVEAFDVSKRAHGVGLWGAAAAIASGLGPPAGGALVAVDSWRLAFLVNVPLGIAAVVLARRCLVESRSPGVRRTPDLLGALLLAAALGALTTGLVQGPDRGWGDWRVLGAFVVGGLALAGFVRSSRTHRSPLLDPALLRIRSFAVGNALTVVAGAGFYAYLLTHVLYLSYVWGYSLLQAGLAVAPAAFVAAVVAALLGKVADRHGHRVILLPGAAVWALSLLWYLERVGPTPELVTQWLPGQVLQGIGVGATLPLLGSAAVARLPKGAAYATASAVVTSARQLGAVLGIAVLVVLIGTPSPEEAREALRAGWVLAALCLAAVALATPLLGRTGPGRATPPEATAAVAPLPVAPTVLQAPPPPPRDPAPVLVDALADVPLFAGLSAEALARLERSAEDVEVDAGDLLFDQGDPADGLYVLRSGRLQVAQGEVVLTELGRGAVVGELGLLTGQVRSAAVRAVRDSRLTRLPAEHFAQVAGPEVMAGLARNLAVRLQEIAPPPTSRSGAADTVVAVVGLDVAASVEACSAGLLDRLRRHVRAVDPGRVDREGLERAEQDADTVLLTATVDDPAWRDLCLRVADRVVLVSGDPEPPAGGLPARAGGADLVLTGPPAGREQRARWETALQPRSVHVAPEGSAASLRPLAARLAGRSLGLVLGGGGARAFAGIGVLEALEEADVVVDRFAGTSVGACVAGLAAAGLDAAAVDAAVYENFVRRNPINDYTLPTRGLVSGRRTAALLTEGMRGLLVEELPHEFRCVSVDLLRRRRVVHRSGPLADAVLCSLRLPGLYPPYESGGTLHVDGGVLDNLPVSALSRSEGPLVAVSVGFGGAGGPSSGVRSGPPRVPALADTLMRTMMMASGDASVRAFEAADLVLRPDTRGIGLLEFHQIDRAREVGRAAVEQALPQVVALLSR
ncbi:MFS transporter [Aquipuribacter sp. SD81]|uniref:MFS transporter n=1 Tax=Aquipuribacter sp. SD81 TaxID=3127703 RepID=UPI00301A9B11